MILSQQTLLLCSALALLALSLVQLAYGRKRGYFRPALDMAFGGLAFALLCTFYLFETRLGPRFQPISVVLVALKIFFIYRAVRGIFGLKAADQIDNAVVIIALSFGCVAAILVNFAALQVMYGIYVTYFYSKAFILVNRKSEKLPKTYLTFVFMYLSCYIAIFTARAVYFLIVPWIGYAYSLSDFGAATTLTTLILFICGNSGVLIIAVFRADQDRIAALKAAVDERDFATDLVSIIGHDLNGYLSGINQGAELITDTSDPALPIINNFSSKARNLLTDLIYYGRSRFEDPNAIEMHSTVDTLISAAVNDVSMAADAKGITIDISTNSGSELVRVDPAAARVVLRNILQNSLKFSGSETTIRISTLKRKNEIGAVLTDQGWGMSREQLKGVRDGRVVQSRVGSSGEQGSGTGLRLITSICRSLGWNMEINSKPGEGTTTTLWFPAAELTPAPDLPPRH